MPNDVAFGQRVRQVRGQDSLAEAARRVQLHGGRVSNVAFQKWERGGEITEQNVRALCIAYGIEPAWLRYGTGPMRILSDAQKVVLEAMDDLPATSIQSTLDFIGYQIQTAHSPAIAMEKAAKYLAVIDAIKADIAKRKGYE